MRYIHFSKVFQDKSSLTLIKGDVKWHKTNAGIITYFVIIDSIERIN